MKMITSILIQFWIRNQILLGFVGNEIAIILRPRLEVKNRRMITSLLNRRKFWNMLLGMQHIFEKCSVSIHRGNITLRPLFWTDTYSRIVFSKENWHLLGTKIAVWRKSVIKNERKQNWWTLDSRTSAVDKFFHLLFKNHIA